MSDLYLNYYFDNPNPNGSGEPSAILRAISTRNAIAHLDKHLGTLIAFTVNFAVAVVGPGC